ncbi:DUF4351 domain-containing protein, partial [Planctomycetota bacterium]
DPENRLYWKIQVAKSLYRRGFTREEVLELFRLIDWLMALPEEFEQEFKREIVSHEEKTHMAYITSVERLSREEGLKKGREQGRLEGAKRVLLRLGTKRFGDPEPSKRAAIDRLESLDELETLTDALLDATDWDDLLSMNT